MVVSVSLLIFLTVDEIDRLEVSQAVDSLSNGSWILTPTKLAINQRVRGGFRVSSKRQVERI